MIDMLGWLLIPQYWLVFMYTIQIEAFAQRARPRVMIIAFGVDISCLFPVCVRRNLMKDT
jgi:hypothetical protein